MLLYPSTCVVTRNKGIFIISRKKRQLVVLLITVTDLVSEVGRVRQQIHISECLAEVLCIFPKSAANTPSPSELIINT